MINRKFMHAEYPHNYNARRWGWGALVAAIAFFAVIALALSRREDTPTNVNVDTNVNNAPAEQIAQTGLSPTAKTYISDKLGIQFTYESQPAENVVITVTEKDNKIYVHGTKETPEQGKMIEVFAKPANATLKQAIEQQFLKTISPNTCFVKEMAQDPKDDRPDNYQLAEISYPAPADPNAPFWQNGSKCPQPYSKTNGVQYFMYNPDVSAKYVFIMLGQDSITTDGMRRASDQAQDWSGSIRIVK